MTGPVSFYSQVLASASMGKPRFQPGARSAMVPSMQDAGIWVGTSVAFIESDFTFYDSNACRLPAETCLLWDVADHIEEVHICYGFNKSQDNFTIPKYHCQPSAPFDPIIACVNILHQANLLAIPKH
jgi:hypothetical protein